MRLSINVIIRSHRQVLSDVSPATRLPVPSNYILCNKLPSLSSAPCTQTDTFTYDSTPYWDSKTVKRGDEG